jgi:iron complex outermembrane receptor protein
VKRGDQRWERIANRRCLIAGLSVASAAFAAFSAHGAENDAADASAASGSMVQEVVVTAQKRSENLVDVPISTSALSADSLVKTGITDLNSIQEVVSGLTIGNSGAHLQPTIRGVGTQVAGPGLAANVATYVDGVYRPNGNTSNYEFSDLQSVEVLKGPQGTLYGQNATGGAILLTTRTPQFTPTADLKVDYGSYNNTTVSVFATAPITRDLAGSLSFYTRHTDGYTKNLFTGDRDGAAQIETLRAKLLYKPTDDLSFLLTYELADANNPNVFVFSNYQGQSVGIFVPGTIVASAPHTDSVDYPARFHSISNNVVLKSEWVGPWVTVTSYTAGQFEHDAGQYDVDGSSAVIEHVQFPASEKTGSQEFQVTSNHKGPLQWVAGLLLYDDLSSEYLTLDSASPPFRVVTPKVQTQSISPFIDATYEVIANLFVTGGVRYSSDHLIEDFSGFPDYVNTHATTTFTAFTPRAVVRYQIDPQQSVYASFNEGYKVGGYNAGGLSTVPVRPERNQAYEVGYKIQRHVWNLQLAAFYDNYTDLQVSSYQGPIVSLVNAARARTYGGEANVAALLTNELQIDAGLSYVKATYTSFPGAPHYVWSPTTGISITPGDATGNPLVNSPEFTARLGATYTKRLDIGTLAFSGHLSYQTTEFFDAFKATKQTPYALLNLRAAWTAPSGKWGLAVFANNVTGQDYLNSVIQQPVDFASKWAEPRIVGVELSAHL